MATVEETIRQTVTRITRKTESDFQKANTFKDLNADSLDIVQILVALEDKYDIEIDNEELANVKTMKDFVQYIERKVAEKGSASKV